ncbi:hypothetical protein GE061_016518 [Apolygus lucorum]|uniref:Uncharacterized protein n=1 Tax=Apolygus lucorum TaxID=248454 RepID=A0A8S9XIJ2_APOLU|nr:hypothetical protein GE061_016518 [Apolygus lucorum]
MEYQHQGPDGNYRNPSQYLLGCFRCPERSFSGGGRPTGTIELRVWARRNQSEDTRNPFHHDPHNAIGVRGGNHRSQPEPTRNPFHHAPRNAIGVRGGNRCNQSVDTRNPFLRALHNAIEIGKRRLDDLCRIYLDLPYHVFRNDEGNRGESNGNPCRKVTTTENATADTGPLRPELEEMNEELAMEDDERTRWDRNVQDGDSRTDFAVPGTSGTTETKEEVTATEMESDDETFLDAMTLPPATTGLASSPDHLDNATPSQPPNNTEINEDRESGTPRRTYGLRQRAPVDYRKLHLGALVQTDHNQTIMTQRQLELEEDMEGDPPFDEFVQQILDTFQEETEANATIPRDTVTTPEPCTFPEQTLAGLPQSSTPSPQLASHVSGNPQR